MPEMSSLSLFLFLFLSFSVSKKITSKKRKRMKLPKSSFHFLSLCSLANISKKKDERTTRTEGPKMWREHVRRNAHVVLTVGLFMLLGIFTLVVLNAGGGTGAEDGEAEGDG